jgi:hypothetical protein
LDLTIGSALLEQWNIRGHTDRSGSIVSMLYPLQRD